jgi:hypothetical protein
MLVIVHDPRLDGIGAGASQHPRRALLGRKLESAKVKVALTTLV